VPAKKEFYPHEGSVYKARTTPDPHQTQGLAKLARRPKTPSDEDVFAYVMEMGTGKSREVLVDWQKLVGEEKLDDLMVVAPAGSYRNWFEDKSSEQLSELKTHLDPVLLKKAVVAPWVTGGGRAMRQRIQYMLDTTDRPRIFIVNCEAVSTVEIVPKLMREFLARGRAMFAIDESTLMRNGKADRTKIIIKLRELAAARRIMTGLISPKSPFDLYWQYYFLDPAILGFESPIGFRERYAVIEKQCFMPNNLIRDRLLKSMGIRNKDSALSDVLLKKKLAIVRAAVGGNTKVSAIPRADVIRKLQEEAAIMPRAKMVDVIPKLGGYVQTISKVKEFRNLDELHKKTEPYSFRVLKKDVLNLPPKIFLPPRMVELTSEQRRLYEEMKANATAEIEAEAHVTATTVITRMIRLHQIVCGHVVDEEGVIHDVKSNRISAIQEILAEHSGKAIIWSTYRHEIEKIAAALRKEYGEESTAMYYGGNKGTRAQDERRFIGDPACRFMVSTQAAGGRGNTWVVADLVIYAANNHDLELRLQSEDRPHRRGQTKSVVYADLQSPGTVEQPIVRALRKKIDMATIINGENYLEWLI